MRRRAGAKRGRTRRMKCRLVATKENTIDTIIRKKAFMRGRKGSARGRDSSPGGAAKTPRRRTGGGHPNEKITVKMSA